MLKSIFSDPQVSGQVHQILTDVAILIGSLLAFFLKQMMQTIQASHMNVLKKMVAERLVTYAEQTITTGGPDKAAYVAAQLKLKFPNIDDDEVKHLLEAAVYQTTKTLGGTQ